MPEKKEIEKLKAANTKLGHEIAELKRSNDLLAAEKKILDEILDNLPGTFYIWDDRPQIIRWNKRHDEVTEYSPDEYLNMLPTDFFGEDEHQTVTAAVEKTFTEGEVTVGNGDGNGDVRAESALQISSFMKFNTYAKISQIRCPWDFASCHGPGYRTKKDIHKRYGPQRFH